MAIQNRRGVYANFDPAKMVPGEFAVVQNDDPDAVDGQSVYIAFSAGNVKRVLLDGEPIPTDTTLTTSGKAADAQATGAELSQRFALTTGDRTSIPTGSNLNTYTSPGNYKVTTGTIASGIDNMPVALSGMLIVLTTSDSAKWHQFYIANVTGGGVRIFCRSKVSSSGSWSDWFELTYRYTFDSAPTEDSENPVTSGGVYDVIQGVESEIVGIDDALNSNIAKNTAVDVSTFKKVTQSPTWESGAISTSTGSKSASTTRIRTSSTMRGTCDALLVSCPANMKIYAFSYVAAIASARFVGTLTDGFQIPDKNGYVLIPITKGMAYALVAAYKNDGTITADAAENITVYKVYMPRTDVIEENTKAFLSHSAKIYGRSYMWELGGIAEASGISASNDYVIRTVGSVEVIGKSILTFTGVELGAMFAYFYDASGTYLGRKTLIDADVVVPDDARSMRLTYGNASSSGIPVTDGLEMVNNFKLDVTADQFSHYLERIGYMPFDVVKGYWAYNGRIKTNTTAICTSALMQLEVGTQIKVVISEPGWFYSTMQGESATSLSFNDRLVNYDSFTVNHPYVGIMFYKSDGQGGYVNLTVDDFDGQIMLFKNRYTENRENEIHDVPENIGVLNVINRAYQMAKLTYEPVANLPTQVNTEAYPHYIPAGTVIEGVMYSSVRNESLYVPQCVSLQTYMTALKNPHSYIYTKTEPEPHYNALTYYGAVCSSMVGWCYGIDDVIPTTVSFDTYDGMEIIENQSPYGLKLGDMLNKSDAHIVIITDIIRNNRGVIKGIEVSEQVNSSSHPYTRHRTLKPDYIQSYYFDGGYVAYRYHYIYKVPYTPSPWINLDDEASEPAWNLNLSPRRGEDANWRVGEDIEIDVTDAGNYTNAKLYKGETLVQTDAIPQDDLLVYSDLAYGSYSVCLTDGSEDSESVRFDIIDVSVLYTALGDGMVRVEYSSANGTPASVSFCEARQNDSDYKATRAFHVLTDAEVSAGEVVLTAPNAGNWLMKTMFKTRFGLYSSDLTEVSVT